MDRDFQSRDLVKQDRYFYPRVWWIYPIDSWPTVNNFVGVISNKLYVVISVEGLFLNIEHWSFFLGGGKKTTYKHTQLDGKIGSGYEKSDPPLSVSHISGMGTL